MEEVRSIRMAGQRGVTLVEVLVTMVILAIGLLGLVALQARVQVLQAEAYQRAQALILLKDMAGRLATNRNAALAYVNDPADPVADVACVAPGAGATRQETDSYEWCLALRGASETLGAGVGARNVGAMAGGRGCVEQPVPGEYLVTVAWQGLVPISAPSAGAACAAGSYDGGADSPCVDDLCRRVVTTVVIIPELT